MAALFGIAEGVLGKIASSALQEAVAIYGVEDQIAEVKETLTAIKAVLLDAEEQQMKNHSLQVWLDRLQDVLYDDDDKVKEQFKLRIWVCVPEDFNLKKIIEEVIKHANGESLRELDIQQLQTHLLDTIKDKKYLLILDDVWSNDHRKWRKLRDLLSEGASESKIIVTTRSLQVASLMGTHPAHHLKGLSYKNSMALFQKCAFDKKEPHPELVEIGKDVVKKCQEVPLLVETLGSLLNSKDDVGEWIRIRDSETWELAEAKKDILPVLKLSYVHLPSHLKRCFLILSLFPRGGTVNAWHLTRLWMALGLISSEKVAPEDVGVEYVKELWRRSLIQDVEEVGTILWFKVHDLVHSLATSLGQNYCLTVDLDTPAISERVRYISISTSSLEEISNYDGVPAFLGKKTSKWVRAINFQYKVDAGVITRTFSRTFISKCNHLRFMDLSYGSLEELPSSICNLKQLRSLNLRENKRLKKLPDTICELQSLLMLDISGCLELGELPKNMKKLVSLRSLFITTKQRSLQESGIQHLENLYLLALKACDNLQVLFEGTCQLTRLRKLNIRNCRGPISLPFGELVALESLNIVNSKLALTSENKPNFLLNLRALVIDKSEQVMELLRCLDGSACTLESFSIFDCPSLTTVPEWLPNHTHLRLIHLIRCPKLSSMPQGIRSLTALKELRIKHCGELSKRCDPQTGKDWNKIAHVPRIHLDLKRVKWTDD